MFRFKWVVDKGDRAYGVAFRFFGIDVSLLLLGFVNDWRFVDLRVPQNYGIFLQLGFALASIGRLPDEDVYATDAE